MRRSKVSARPRTAPLYVRVSVEPCHEGAACRASLAVYPLRAETAHRTANRSEEEGNARGDPWL